MVCIIILYYDMITFWDHCLSYMRSVVDRNVVMRRILLFSDLVLHKAYVTAKQFIIIMCVALRTPGGHGVLILEVPRTHTTANNVL